MYLRLTDPDPGGPKTYGSGSALKPVRIYNTCWHRYIGNFSLFRIPCGSLCAVVGSVGAGKSSLLCALLGEMEQLSGGVQLAGQLAYVSQQAWIQNARLRHQSCPFSPTYYQGCSSGSVRILSYLFDPDPYSE
jgi:ABC-type multidrug transport system ATPase subunit